MYVTKKESDNSFRICPQATSLQEVNSSCTGGVLYTGQFPQKQSIEGRDITVSQASISGVTYWIADGLSGTGGQGEYTEKTVPIGQNITWVKDLTASVEGAIAKAVDQLDSTPLGSIEKERLTTVSATATAVTATVGLASILSSIGSVGYGISQIFVNIFSSLGFRRKRYSAGYVYDSTTRAPIQQAIIRIFDTSKKLVDTSVTDGYGIFKTSVPSGEYILEVKKRGYIYPSSLIVGKQDYPLSNVYHGEKIYLKENEINIVIPLDPDINFAPKKILTLFRSILSSIFPLINIFLFTAGLVIAIYVYVKDSSMLNLAILLLYIPTTYMLFRNILNMRKRTGKVVYPDGTPASNIPLILKDVDFNKVVGKRVTDKEGRYSFDISEKGNYQIQSADSKGKNC